MPPMYWSTGIHLLATAGVVGDCSFHGSVKRMKYQDESTKVSMVSVSRRAQPLQLGHLTRFQLVARSSGLPGFLKLTLVGNFTGSFFSGTGTTPHVLQWITGIGQPQ